MFKFWYLKYTPYNYYFFLYIPHDTLKENYFSSDNLILSKCLLPSEKSLSWKEIIYSQKDPVKIVFFPSENGQIWKEIIYSQ